MITRSAKRRAEEEAASNDARRRRSSSPQAGPSESSDSNSISAPSSADIDSEIIEISDDESDDSGDTTVVGEYVDLLNDPEPIEYFVNRLENYPEILQDDCAICRKKLTRHLVIFQCGHAFHELCVDRLICGGGIKCPSCRAEITECTIKIRSATDFTVRSFTQLELDHWNICPFPPVP